MIRLLGPRTTVRFRKRDDGDYSVTANIDVGPESFGGHWFDVGARVPAGFSALRVSDNAYNNHGEFRGHHTVVITRDYGVWHIDGDEGDNWDIAQQIGSVVAKERRDGRSLIGKGVFGLSAVFGIILLGSGAPIEGTEEVVLIAVVAFGVGGLFGLYLSRPCELPRLTIFDPKQPEE